MADGSLNQQLYIYRQQVKVIHQLLVAECPEMMVTERSLSDEDIHPFTLEILKTVYNKLFAQLIKCRTTPCRTATNLTEYWRMDHNASSIAGGGERAYSNYACDIRPSLKWFRFTGKAGKKMLDNCVPEYSCGTDYPMWADADMPKRIAQTITVQAWYSGNGCASKIASGTLQVLRCSESEYDVVYKHLPTSYSSTCNRAFCGMD
ncbi:oncoprotein-induced transcript 3 protein-like [Watersipora subatra]|uniref:oncoprotein-induced transcript 3 protein-like n=1 Tax=Watersipora subatra TaxID=2589382 RepID=UPI00355B750C